MGLADDRKSVDVNEGYASRFAFSKNSIRSASWYARYVEKYLMWQWICGTALQLMVSGSAWSFRMRIRNSS